MLASLQGLRFIGIGAHDSIGVGEGGPTDQSIAYSCTKLTPLLFSINLGTFFRALSNFNLIRPADAEEVLGAWKVARTSLFRRPRTR